MILHLSPTMKAFHPALCGNRRALHAVATVAEFRAEQAAGQQVCARCVAKLAKDEARKLARAGAT